MVEQQVRAWDVLDEKVLQTMLQVQREEFAPLRYRDVAFADSVIPLAHGQTMLPAKVHGRILQALAVGEGDVALEVGAGSGYLAACLGKLASRVRSLEIFPELAEQAHRATGVARQVCDVYLSGLDYGLSYPHIAGLTEFYRRLVERGRIPNGTLTFLPAA